MRLADIAVARPLPGPLTYEVPEEFRAALAEGSRVVVPLGGGAVEGIVLAQRDGDCPDGVKLRRIRQLLGDRPELTPDLIALGRWIAGHYICSIGEALSAMVHPHAPPRRTVLYELIEGAQEPRGPRQREIFKWLEAQEGPVSLDGIRQALGEVSAILRPLVAKGILRKSDREPAPVEPEATELELDPQLTPEQSEVRDSIAASMDRREAEVHVIHGVTGSGKSEIYLQLVRRGLEHGTGAIFLVPEISLTVPMIELFRKRFGPDMALFHSSLTPSERHREWSRVRGGTARVVVGARSAVFAPVVNLGLIIVDEEAETSYKQYERPGYHARDTAIQRGRLGSFPVVLGSATPSLEVYHSAQQSPSSYHRLTGRFNKQPLPEVELIDMAQEFRERRNRSIFSWRLKEELEATLAAGRQCLLFLNRRGHSTYVFCRACGHVLECHQCSVALTYHQSQGLCRCHQCDFERPSPPACPACQDPAIRFLGLGTQRVEEELQLNYPGVSHARMDSDTTSRRGSHQRIIEDFSSGKTQVLIGTQMVAKGFNFTSLDLVGVVNADVALRLPDFRASERTFQLVTQVAGRVGRADRPGRVLVQTYAPTHPALIHARGHDYISFADGELPQRQTMFYPPFCSLILVLTEAKKDTAGRQALEDLKSRLEAGLADSGRHSLLGPARAPLERVRSLFRHHLLLKLAIDAPCQERARKLLGSWRPPSGVQCRIDVDPLFLG